MESLFSFFGESAERESCNCESLEQYRPIVRGVTYPVILCYFLLIILGISNLIRFYRVNQLSKNLIPIYVWCLLSNLSWAVFLSLVFYNNAVQYLPYATAMYTKIQVGIAYQSNIFDLKYVVGFYFSDAEHKIDQATFSFKRKRMQCLMTSWSIIVICVFLADISINYVYYYYFYDGFDDADTDGDGLPDEPPTSFMIITYILVSTFFGILLILIVWQTLELVKIIKVMGTRLESEKKRLKQLMVIFSISYLGITVYYLYQVINDIACTHKGSCVRFNALMAISGVLLAFDILPVSVLYYQHYSTSVESLRQVQGLKEQSKLESREKDSFHNAVKNSGQSEYVKVVEQEIQLESKDREYEVLHLQPALSQTGSERHTLDVKSGDRRNLKPPELIIGETRTVSGFSMTDTMSQQSLPQTLLGTVRPEVSKIGSSQQTIKENLSSSKRRSRTVNSASFAMQFTDDQDLSKHINDPNHDSNAVFDVGMRLPTSQSVLESMVERPTIRLEDEGVYKGRFAALRMSCPQGALEDVPIMFGFGRDNFWRAVNDHQLTTNSHGRTADSQNGPSSQGNTISEHRQINAGSSSPTSEIPSSIN